MLMTPCTSRMYSLASWWAGTRHTLVYCIRNDVMLSGVCAGVAWCSEPHGGVRVILSRRVGGALVPHRDVYGGVRVCALYGARPTAHTRSEYVYQFRTMRTIPTNLIVPCSTLHNFRNL
jgi:hypothetical protein